MSLSYYDSTNFLRQKGLRIVKSATFSVFIHYLLLRLQTDIFQIRTDIFQIQAEIQIQTDIFQIQTDIRLQTDIFQIQTEMLCFTCLQLTASLTSQKFSSQSFPLKSFPLKSFSSQNSPLKSFLAFLLKFQYKNVLLHEKGPADVPRKNVVGPMTYN